MTKILFAGDLCVAGASTPTLGQELLSILGSSDFFSVNYEGPLLRHDVAAAPKAGPSLRQVRASLDFLRRCKATHVNLANNHIMDFGVTGLESTLHMLQGYTALGAGLSFQDAYQVSMIEHDGQRIALLAFAEAQFGVSREIGEAGFAWVDAPAARWAIRDARQSADWVIVQVHAGLEMVDVPIPEWRDRYRELVDLGADIVVGHHPHVLQGVEFYKGKAIYYSLGNFFMDILLQQDRSGSGGILEVIIENGTIRSRVIHLCISTDRIDVDESLETKRRYQRLCGLLTDESAYRLLVDTVCLSFWKDVYAKYYESALTGLGAHPDARSIWPVIRKLLSSILKGARIERSNCLMLLHNIRIESHRWVVERALAIKALRK